MKTTMQELKRDTPYRREQRRLAAARGSARLAQLLADHETLTRLSKYCRRVGNIQLGNNASNELARLYPIIAHAKRMSGLNAELSE